MCKNTSNVRTAGEGNEDAWHVWGAVKQLSVPMFSSQSLWVDCIGTGQI